MNTGAQIRFSGKMCIYEYYYGVDKSYSGVDTSDSGVDTFHWAQAKICKYVKHGTFLFNTIVCIPYG